MARRPDQSKQMRVSRLGWLAFFFVGSSPPFSPPLSFTIVRCSSLGAHDILRLSISGRPIRRIGKPEKDSMSKLRVHNFAISLDGYGAGPRQGLKDPLGVGGEELHGWYIGTRAFREINGKTGGTTGPDNDFAKRFGERIGAYIMGRNMFGPVRGPWPDDRWRGWWGENPPYHVPVFVLTNHAREPITMKGGTVFHFVTGGIEEALRRAREAAGGLDIQVGGGASTVRQYLQARLIDEMHVAIAPILLGSGEALFAGMDLPALGYACTEHVATPAATHVVLARKA